MSNAQRVKRQKGEESFLFGNKLACRSETLTFWWQRSKPTSVGVNYWCRAEKTALCFNTCDSEDACEYTRSVRESTSLWKAPSLNKSPGFTQITHVPQDIQKIQNAPFEFALCGKSVILDCMNKIDLSYIVLPIYWGSWGEKIHFPHIALSLQIKREFLLCVAVMPCSRCAVVWEEFKIHSLFRWRKVK